MQLITAKKSSEISQMAFLLKINETVITGEVRIEKQF